MALKEDVFAATFAYASRIHSKCRPFSKNKCNISNNQAESGSRNGIGCCQMSVPDGVVDYDMTVERVLKNSTDINECQSSSNPCADRAVCQNLHGSDKCSCPKGYKRDGKRIGTQCTKDYRKDQTTLKLVIALCICVGLLIDTAFGSLVGLAKRCLRIREEERPNMKEVATELEGLNKKTHYHWDKRISNTRICLSFRTFICSRG
ncbi:hypothetical protein FEM48_Zijuj01G0322500 [Ziziphus jujuba var. spinosa]|uniref:EGF-like domain-containing protein n=1 Tax=Ziziphus jujuba var. spinosa TaxID=714518 RepID=A0A978W6H3_ZIZJJ|nr:hypothetical protein FEM48_Zijuj01G0322500 [Ziziphus jujuba var. spinosa]